MTNEEAIKRLEIIATNLCGQSAQNPNLWPDYKAVDIAISALRRQDVPDKDVGNNEPLTLEELREMDGWPVYSVEITGREEWLFRRDSGFADMYGEFTSDDFMSWDNYGKLWWCYRQKPEDGTD